MLKKVGSALSRTALRTGLDSLPSSGSPSKEFKLLLVSFYYINTRLNKEIKVIHFLVSPVRMDRGNNKNKKEVVYNY
jgi:hypothetical protein